MSTPEAKRVKTNNDDAPYELIYWPGIPGRGELVRLLFEEAGVPYNDVAKTAGKKAVPAVLGYMSPDNTGDATNPPVFAPPILKHGGLVINQTPNILLYLAPRLGLAPAAGDDALFHLNEMVLTMLDGFVGEVHETHHPVATSLTYEEQKPEARKRSGAFVSERLPKYLGYVQRVLDAKTSGDGPWLYGDKLTYADLVLYQVSIGRAVKPPLPPMALLKQWHSASTVPSTRFQRPWAGSNSRASMTACSSSAMRSRRGPGSRSTWRATAGWPTRMGFGGTTRSWTSKRRRWRYWMTGIHLHLSSVI